ncbi:MAG: hypothetical protein KGJ23_04300 [Euryarchaeota archaeon]|nr:hypothetical protein [Euryarchaeota archaeon]MDE1835821.1 hypothetical protein [Euryarchaeota archaeon]MDE1880528.1 hypothetical protein [Euryarchaeota archaeon]MDE2045795.1 hypothetical protein [Thermoplasmata archaeon]
MSERFDVIVVGNGVAGGLIASDLRAAGRSVLLLEPKGGSAPRPAGGVLWRTDVAASPLGKGPGAPLLRRIVERRVGFLTSDAALSINFRDLAWATTSTGWVLDRAPAEAWARGRAQRAGATVVQDAVVEAVLADRAGRVTGVKAGGKSSEAALTIFEDPGVLPLAAKSGVRAGARSGGVGDESVVESVFDLPPSRVDDKFGAGPGRGFTFETVLGYLPKGAMALGFVYPGNASVHVGVVVHDRSVSTSGIGPKEVMNRFETHPEIAPFLRGGARRSTTTLSIPTKRSSRMSLYGDGFLVVGDAALAGASSGIAVRGADLTLQSATAAAATAREAIETKDTSGRMLARYPSRLRAAGMLDGLGQADPRAARLRWNPRLHQAYPALLSSFFRRMMTEKGQPKEHLRSLLEETVKGSAVPYTALGRDAVTAVFSL